MANHGVFDKGVQAYKSAHSTECRYALLYAKAKVLNLNIC